MLQCSIWAYLNLLTDTLIGPAHYSLNMGMSFKELDMGGINNRCCTQLSDIIFFLKDWAASLHSSYTTLLITSSAWGYQGRLKVETESGFPVRRLGPIYIVLVNLLDAFPIVKRLSSAATRLVPCNGVWWRVMGAKTPIKPFSLRVRP